MRLRNLKAWGWLVLAAYLAGAVGTQASAQADHIPAAQEFRKYFAHFADRRSMRHKAFNAIGLEPDVVGRSFALIAGVANYDHSRVPDLDPAAVDIAKLTSYLRDQELFDEIVVLQDEAFTERNLRYFLQAYFPARVGEFPKSRFLFAFSGHGINDGNEGYLLESNAESLEDKFNAINLRVVRTMLQEVVQKGHHVLALVNACYGGNFVRPSFGQKQFVLTRPGAHALTAGSANELVYAEPEMGPGSVFFETVLAALDERADTWPPADPARQRSGPGDGVITFDELATWVKLSIRAYTSESVNPLHGDLSPIAKPSLGAFFFLNRRRQVEAGVVEEWDPDSAVAFGVRPAEPEVLKPAAATTSGSAAGGSLSLRGTALSIPSDLGKPVLFAIKNANVRDRPEVDGRKITTLQKGTPVTLVAKIANRNWLKVRLREGQEGYVYAPLLAEQAETNETRQAVEGIKDSTKDLTKSGLEKMGEKWNYFKQGFTW